MLQAPPPPPPYPDPAAHGSPGNRGTIKASLPAPCDNLFRPPVSRDICAMRSNNERAKHLDVGLSIRGRARGHIGILDLNQTD